jgi:hypothetical protein
VLLEGIGDEHEPLFEPNRPRRPVVPPHPAQLTCPSPLLLSPRGRGRVRVKGLR